MHALRKDDIVLALEWLMLKIKVMNVCSKPYIKHEPGDFSPWAPRSSILYASKLYDQATSIFCSKCLVILPHPPSFPKLVQPRSEDRIHECHFAWFLTKFPWFVHNYFSSWAHFKYLYIHVVVWSTMSGTALSSCPIKAPNHCKMAPGSSKI